MLLDRDDSYKKNEYEMPSSPVANGKPIAGRVSFAASSYGMANKTDFNLDLDRKSVESIDQLKQFANPASMSKMQHSMLSKSVPEIHMYYTG